MIVEVVLGGIENIAATGCWHVMPDDVCTQQIKARNSIEEL